MARSSAFSFKGQGKPVREIGNELGVSHVLEGSVRKSGEDLRISVQLIDVESGFNLWSETFDRKLASLFEIQDEIARTVVAEVSPRLLQGLETVVLVEAPTENQEAYDLILRAIAEYRSFAPGGIERGIELADRALALEPDFALAHAAKGDALHIFFIGGRESAREDAFVSLERAVELDPKNHVANRALCELHAIRFEWEQATSRCRVAMEGAIDHSGAAYLILTGRTDEFSVRMKKAVSLNPLDPLTKAFLEIALLSNGEYEQALQQIRRARERGKGWAGGQFRATWMGADGSRRQCGLMAHLRDFFLDAGETNLAGQIENIFETEGADAFYEWYLGFLTSEERPVDFDKLMGLPERSNTAAQVAIRLGHLDRAFDILNEGGDERSGSDFIFAVIQMHPFAPLREHPRYDEMLESQGLVGDLVAKNREGSGK